MNSLDLSVSSRGGTDRKLGSMSLTLEHKKTEQLAMSTSGLTKYVDPHTAQQKEKEEIKQRRKDRLFEALDVESGKIAKPPNPFTRALSVDQGPILIKSVTTKAITQNILERMQATKISE